MWTHRWETAKPVVLLVSWLPENVLAHCTFCRMNHSYRKLLANTRPSNGGSRTKCERLVQEKLNSSTYASVSALALRKWSGTSHILQSDSCGNANNRILIEKRICLRSYARTK